MTNISEILKNAPQGLKLYSLVHGKVALESVDTPQDYYPIDIVDEQRNNEETLTKDGRLYSDYKDAECILFPSKEHKSWENWQEVLFQVGDIIKYKSSKHKEEVNIQIDIYVYNGYDKSINEYIGYNIINKNEDDLTYLTINEYEYATPEECDQFFKELNANGYKWNADTKQIEKIEQQYTPKYKVGDWLYDNDHGVIQITDIIGGNDGLYCFNNECQNLISLTDKFSRLATEQELIDAGIKEKPFTIDDLKPFDKVLVRDNYDSHWEIELFAQYDTNIQYICLTCAWRYCIPYNDETKHLLGTTDDCPDKYKNW